MKNTSVDPLFIQYIFGANIKRTAGNHSDPVNTADDYPFNGLIYRHNSNFSCTPPARPSRNRALNGSVHSSEALQTK